jgi:regulator of Ty1 transposition protein 103
MLGGSIFSSSSSSGSIPSELAPLVTPQMTISKLTLTTRTSVNSANQEYEKMTDPTAVIPTPPVHAARLNGVLKTLANAEGAVAESIKARKELINGLEKLLETNRAALLAEETQLAELSTRRVNIDTKKREVEDSIMQGLASTSSPATPVGVGNSNGTDTGHTTPGEPDRPEFEALTPPPFEALTPEPAEPDMDFPQPTDSAAEPQDSSYVEAAAESAPPSAPASAPAAQALGADLLSSLSTAYPDSSGPSQGSAKKRKLDDGEMPDLGIDEDLGLDVSV